MAVELYHFWSSVCSVRCRMALEEKGVPWESRYIDLFQFQQMEPEYLAINPAGVVPTLVHDGEPIRESTIINEYIDAAFDGPALVPADPVKAARMREFIHDCEEDFPAIVKLTYVNYILPKLRNRWGDEELRKQAERRPLRFYKDIHGRGIRGEIGADELAEAGQVIEAMLDRLDATLEGQGLDRRRLLARRHRDRPLHVPARRPRPRPLLVRRQAAERPRLVRPAQRPPGVRRRRVLAGRERRRLRGGRADDQAAGGGVRLRQGRNSHPAETRPNAGATSLERRPVGSWLYPAIGGPLGQVRFGAESGRTGVVRPLAAQERPSGAKA